MSKKHAFTLIELLVVMAIIGIVAALVVNMNSGAQTAKRNAQVNADKAKLALMIDNYQSKLNFYPPDNGILATLSVGSPANFAIYDGWAATNPLIYELTGATNLTNGNILAFDGSTYPSNYYIQVFGRASIANSNPDEPHSFFIPQPKEYTNYISSQYTNLLGLLVPLPVTTIRNTDGTTPANYWHYDASSPNRHNPSSYDLWAEYISTSKGGSNIITTNGNW
jgi:prepilin-type N-terminal cleavage/methylation domain-containing protein